MTIPHVSSGAVDRPLLVDFFCCSGGASMGYHRAGFDVVGFDIDPQPDYPFRFVPADAIEVLTAMVAQARRGERVTFEGRPVAAGHGSPPCQHSTALTKGTNKGREYPNLIPQTRELFTALPFPSVIENVQGSDVRRDAVLCGEMFGLGVIRHRYFEGVHWRPTAPTHKPHRGRVAGMRHGEWFTGPYFAVYGEGGGKGTVAQWQTAMGIDWTSDRKAIAEAIPPAYTEHVGNQLIAELAERAA